MTAAFAAEGIAGKSVAATAALAERACGHAAQDRLTFVSPFQHASMQHVPTIPPSSASSMAASDDELAHDEHSSAEVFTAAVGTTRVLPDQDESAHDTLSSAQKPTAALRTVTVLPDQDDALGCALAAEQSFLSMGAGSLCGGSEFSASEDYDGLVCFNEGVQVAPPPWMMLLKKAHVGCTASSNRVALTHNRTCNALCNTQTETWKGLGHIMSLQLPSRHEKGILLLSRTPCWGTMSGSGCSPWRTLKQLLSTHNQDSSVLCRVTRHSGSNPWRQDQRLLNNNSLKA